MKLCMIGTGYVGLVSGVCFSDLGNTVYCVDKDQLKINLKIRCQLFLLNTIYSDVGSTRGKRLKTGYVN